MGRFWVTVAVFLVLVAAVMALRCYKCEGTEDDCAKSVLQSNKDKYLITCPFGADKCFRSFLKKDSETHVLNSCTNQLGCNWAQDVCDKYADDITCKIGCCDEDECNVGSHVSFNPVDRMLCPGSGITDDIIKKAADQAFLPFAVFTALSYQIAIFAY